VNREEYVSNYWIRCPWCEREMRVNDIEGIYEEDGHDVFCDECDREFRVVTRVLFSFTSPGLAVEEEGE
jgi:hypothetical protein